MALVFKQAKFKRNKNAEQILKLNLGQTMWELVPERIQAIFMKILWRSTTTISKLAN